MSWNHFRYRGHGTLLACATAEGDVRTDLAASTLQGSAAEGADGTLLVCVKQAEVSTVPLGVAAAFAQARPATYRVVNDGTEVRVCAV